MISTERTATSFTRWVVVTCFAFVVAAPGWAHAQSRFSAMVQGETDTCYRMPADVLRAEIDRRDAFHDLMVRYAQALGGFIMQSTACNAVHSVEQRLARWLLLAHDRVGKNEFSLTQEFVAMMLGVSRPTVTIVASTLQKAGLITYHRGHLTIVDREKLEAASCECYRTFSVTAGVRFATCSSKSQIPTAEFPSLPARRREHVARERASATTRSPSLDTVEVDRTPADTA
jgi:hypothetical protein